MPVTRARAAFAAKKGTSAPMLASSTRSASSANIAERHIAMLLPEPRPESQRGQVRLVEREAGRTLALDTEPTAAGHQEEPVGKLEQLEDAVEQVMAVRTSADDREVQVQLGGRVEAQRGAHRSGAS